jgi:hypothetical protein
LALKRIKELSRREDQNILELEIDEMMTEDVEISERDGQFPISGTLNFFSFRSSSFTALVKGERSINLFFRFLNSPDRNAEVP